MPRRRLTLDGNSEIEQVALERAKLPTDVELARKHGVSRRRIQQIMKSVRDVFLGVDAQKNPENIAPTTSLRSDVPRGASHTSPPCPSSSELNR